MKKLYVMFTMDCESIDSIATEGGPVDWAFSRRSMEGYVKVLNREGYAPTLFISPPNAEENASMLLDLHKSGAELALHVHPQDFGYCEYLGAYDHEAQVRIIGSAAEHWAEKIGFLPTSFRGGNLSANDATAGALCELGFRQGSLSVPGRSFTRVKSNWAGAPMNPWHMNKANRLLEGDLDFLEIPVTADWESVMWGGLTKLELRIEMVDARAHGFTIRKNVERQLKDQIEEPYLCILTHNIFDYSDPSEFRSQVLEGVIREIQGCAALHELTVAGLTLEQYHKAYDAK